MDYFKTHKYGTAVTLSAAVHILAFYLASFWVVDHRINIPKEAKVIIHNVRLKKPVKPEPEPIPRPAAEAAPIANAGHRVEPVRPETRPIDYFSDEAVMAKIPARLSSFITGAKIQASRVSPSPPSMDAFNDAAARSSAEAIQYSLVKPRAMNAKAKNYPVNDSSSKLIFKPMKIPASVRASQSQAVKAAPKKHSAARAATEISPIGMVATYSFTNDELPESQLPMSIADSETTGAVTVSPAIGANFQTTNFPARQVTPVNMIFADQSVSGKNPVRLEGFSIAAKISFPASPAQPANETFLTGAYNPSKVSIGNSFSGPANMIAVAKKYSQEPAVESDAAVNPADMTDFQTIKFIKNKTAPIIMKEAFSAVSGNKPVGLAGIDRMVTSGASRLPVITAAVPQDFIYSDEDRKKSAEELNQLKAVFTRKVRDRIALVKMYPRRARIRGFEGQPVVAFTLSRNGSLTKYSIVTSSGYQILDKSALESVKKAVPYPPIPDKLNIESINLKLPITYILR